MRLILVCIVCISIAACQGSREDAGSWTERETDSFLTIRHGIPAYGDTAIHYIRNDARVMKVRLGEPVTVAVADKPEGWGFFQFPSVYRSNNGQLVVKWHMAHDAAASYGKDGFDFAVSDDEGKTWTRTAGKAPAGGGLLLPNGDRIRIDTPVAIDTSELRLPHPVGGPVKEAYGRTFSYYRHDELPAQLQGVYLGRLSKGDSAWTKEHNILHDSIAVRYTDNALFPVVWWGDMHMTGDGGVMAGIYPGFCIENGKVDPNGVFFYKSTDAGKSWNIQGRIPYVPDLSSDPNGGQRLTLGFTEPAFEVLSDGSYLCVLRTTDGLGFSPMYKSRSTDEGKTWSAPRVFTSSGVLPRLLQLENGVVVLASGRPGVQLRFSGDGEGEEWTEPFEMFPFEDNITDKPSGGARKTPSCGYTEILTTGKDRFLIVYSDFNHPTADGQVRKAIKVREVVVDAAR